MKQKVILFEGPDRCGKTEISKELSRITGVPYFKNEAEKIHFRNMGGADFATSTKFVEPYFASYLVQTRASVIMDRCYPSEYAYSSVFSRNTDIELLRRVDEVYAQLDARIIICKRSSYIGMSDDQFDVIDEYVMRNIDDAYEYFAKHFTKCKVAFVNVDDENLRNEISQIRTQFPDIFE